jgi:hypothetical protein
MNVYKFFYQTKAYVFSFFICAIIFILIFLLSLWQGQYSNDPHHWGFMLSTAKDYANPNLIAYKDIFIQYGILTTALHSLAYLINPSLVSLISITTFFYASGVLFTYLLTYEISKSIKLSFYVLTTVFLFHPIVIYPWSNYMAYPFILLGYLFYKSDSQKQISIFLSGIFFALAILSREGLFLPILCIYCFFIFFDSEKNKMKRNVLLTLGLLSPLLLFFAYLFLNGLFDYWYKYSIMLPKLYFELYPNAGIKGIPMFFYEIIKKLGKPDFRWSLMGLIFFVNSIILTSFTVDFFRNSKNKKHVNIKIAALCLGAFLLITSSLHIKELFRLATGSIIGIIPLYIYFERRKQAGFFFIFIFFLLSTSMLKNNSGNYFFPTQDVISNSKFVSAPKFFNGQKLPEKTIEFYKNIEADFLRIENSGCNIKYHYNYSMDSFIQVLSPFKQFQVTPSAWALNIESLRPEFDIQNKITRMPDDIVLIYGGGGRFNDLPKTIPPNFHVYSHYTVPPATFIMANQSLKILVPNSCPIKKAP